MRCIKLQEWSKGRVIVVPSAKDKSSFIKFAHEYKWIESVLGHSAPSTEEGAEWVSYYMAKRHKFSFLVSAKDCGLLVIQKRMHLPLQQ
jgi:hypothetical protein